MNNHAHPGMLARRTLPQITLHRRHPDDLGVVVHPRGTAAGLAQETRVARALCQAWSGEDTWDELLLADRDAWRDWARLAITALVGAGAR